MSCWEIRALRKYHRISLELPCDKRHYPTSEAWLKPVQAWYLLERMPELHPQLHQKLLRVTAAVHAEK